VIRVRAFFIAAILGVLSLGSFGAGTALASTGGPCGDAYASRQADANMFSQSTPNYIAVDGSFAYISKNDTYFKLCTQPPVSSGDGPSAWVSLIPGPSNPNYGDLRSIVQIGITICNFSSLSVCDSTVNVFWASASCNVLQQPWPGYISGTDPGSDHYFEVRLNNSLHRVEYYGPDGTLAKTTSYSDPGISCWITGPLMSAIAGETVDRGDSLGGASDSQTIRFTHMQYHSPQYGWARYGDHGTASNPQYIPSPFGDVHDPQFDHGDDGVAYSREVWMRVWTQYQP
jgi:hypothetical protein